ELAQQHAEPAAVARELRQRERLARRRGRRPPLDRLRMDSGGHEQHAERRGAVHRGLLGTGGIVARHGTRRAQQNSAPRYHSAPMRNGPVTHRLLQRLCYDVWLRGPSPSELRLLVGSETGDVVGRLLHSREAMAVWFEEQLQYFLLLDQFRPPADVTDRIPGRLFKGELDARAAFGEILLSTGFSLRNPGNDTFVTVVLEQCLGYRVQDPKIKPILEAGKKIYDGKKGRFLGQEGQSQSDL